MARGRALGSAERISRAFVEAIAQTEEEVDELLYRENAARIDARARSRARNPF